MANKSFLSLNFTLPVYPFSTTQLIYDLELEALALIWQ